MPQQVSPSFRDAVRMIAADPSICASELSEDLSLEELAELRPLCGLDCESECPYHH